MNNCKGYGSKCLHGQQSPLQHEHIDASMHHLEHDFHLNLQVESLRGRGGDGNIRTPSNVPLRAQQNDMMTDHTTILAQINNNLAAIAQALQSMTKKELTEMTDLNCPRFQIHFSVTITNKRTTIIELDGLTKLLQICVAQITCTTMPPSQLVPFHNYSKL